MGRNRQKKLHLINKNEYSEGNFEYFETESGAVFVIVGGTSPARVVTILSWTLVSGGDLKKQIKRRHRTTKGRVKLNKHFSKHKN